MTSWTRSRTEWCRPLSLSLLVGIVADERLNVALALLGDVCQLGDDVVEVVVVLGHGAAERRSPTALPGTAGHGLGGVQNSAGEGPQVLHGVVDGLDPSLGFRRR